jgi:hypothetical protein
MARYFDIKLTTGTAPGPYNIYYDLGIPGNIATITSSSLPATGVTYTILTTGTGLNITVPDSATVIVVVNLSCNTEVPHGLPAPTPTPTQTQTPTKTPAVTSTPTLTRTPTPTLPALLLSVSSSTPQTCYTSSNATFTLSASGGNGAPYEYSKDNVNWQTGATFSNLAGGTYSGYVRNNNRTGTVASVSVGSLSRSAPNATFTLSNYNGYGLSCNGGANGSIAVTSGTGGSGSGYSGSTDDVTYYALPKTFSGLTAGVKTIYIKDSTNLCMQSYDQTLTQPTAQTATLTVVQVDDGTGNGEVQASSTGGVWPKTYKLYADTSSPYSDYSTDNLIGTITGVTSGATTQFFSNLTGGYYWLQVTDANGCITNSTNEVSVFNYIYIGKLDVGTNLTSCATGQGVLTNTYLISYDYASYVANGILTNGMRLYPNASGGSWTASGNTVFDPLYGIIYFISGGVIGNIKTLC